MQRAAAEYLYSHFPGLEDKLSIDDYLEERAREQDRMFKEVPPMRGAVELVQGLVSLVHAFADAAEQGWHSDCSGDRV